MGIIHIVWLKYTPFIIVGFAFLYLIYKIINTDHLLDFLKKSLQDENGKPSGKSISGFACINSLLAGFFVNIYYSEHHVPEEWYGFTIAGLVASFYGLKELGRFTSSKYSGVGSGVSSPELTQAPSSPPPVVEQTNQKSTDNEIG